MPTETLGARGGSAPGAITLARHGEPNISRKVKLTAAEYDAWWARYEQTGLAPGQTAPLALCVTAKGAGAILCSTRLRAIESARAVAGDRNVKSDVQFIEAPLPPPHWPGWFKLRPRYWGVVSRFWWWFFDHHDDQERRKAAQLRADEAAAYLMALAAGGEDVLLIAHGFFNFMIGRSLKRHGWSLVANQGHRYWSTRRFVFRGG